MTQQKQEKNAVAEWSTARNRSAGRSFC